MLRRVSDLSVILLAIVFATFMWRANARITALEARFTPGSQRPASPVARSGVVDDDGVSVGSAAAPVTLVQFTDYECPFCARFAKESLPALYAAYVTTGKVRLLIRDLPLPIHANARALAEAARCAATLTPRIHEFQQALYGDGASKADDVLARAAEAVGLDESALRNCVNSGAAAEISRDSVAAAHTGIRGTPTFVIGPTADSIRGRIISGAQPLAAFTAVIDSLLASVGAGRNPGS
jgi:protein-disulfide isomerase